MKFIPHKGSKDAADAVLLKAADVKTKSHGDSAQRWL